MATHRQSRVQPYDVWVSVRRPDRSPSLSALCPGYSGPCGRERRGMSFFFRIPLAAAWAGANLDFCENRIHTRSSNACTTWCVTV